MDKTANYNLPQWVGTDPIRMKPFNDAFDGIDAALKANAWCLCSCATIAGIASSMGRGIFFMGFAPS